MAKNLDEALTRNNMEHTFYVTEGDTLGRIGENILTVLFLYYLNDSIV